MGRKYGLGKYGRSTYDLGDGVTPEPPIGEWIPIPVPPGFPCNPPEIWAGTPVSPGFPCDVPEIWTPITVPVMQAPNG